VRVRLVALLAVLWSGCLSAQIDPNSKNVTVYRDGENGFILTYPNTWSSVPTTYERTRIKIVSERGEGAEDCVVNVQPVPGGDGVTLEQYMKNLPNTAQQREQQLQKAIPGAKVLMSTDTHIANQAARLDVIAFTVRSVGIEAPVRMLLVQTFHAGKVYSVGCRSSPETLDKNMPVFQIIFAGFAFISQRGR